MGAFSIERELGRGGMGVVYLGRDTRLDRAVAAKTLPEDLATSPERLARFEREAKIPASLAPPPCWRRAPGLTPPLRNPARPQSVPIFRNPP